MTIKVSRLLPHSSIEAVNVSEETLEWGKQRAWELVEQGIIKLPTGARGSEELIRDERDGVDRSLFLVMACYGGFLNIGGYSEYFSDNLEEAIQKGDNAAITSNLVYMFIITEDQRNHIDAIERHPLAIWWNGSRVRLSDW